MWKGYFRHKIVLKLTKENHWRWKVYLNSSRDSDIFCLLSPENSGQKAIVRWLYKVDVADMSMKVIASLWITQIWNTFYIYTLFMSRPVKFSCSIHFQTNQWPRKSLWETFIHSLWIWYEGSGYRKIVYKFGLYGHNVWCWPCYSRVIIYTWWAQQIKHRKSV